MRYRYSVPVTAPLELPEAQLPIDPYLLGVWLGDGHSYSSQISVGREDLGFLVEQLKPLVPSITIEKDKTCFRLKFPRDGSRCLRGHILEKSGLYRNGACAECSRQFSKTWRSPWLGNRIDKKVNFSLHDKLRQLGVLKNKSIPLPYLRGSIMQRLFLLQGLMDTDGHVTKLGRCEFITTKERLRQGVGELLSGLGIKHTWKEKQVYRNGRKFGAIAYRTNFTVHESFPVFRNPRKSQRLISPKNGRPYEMGRRHIAKIDPVKSVPVCCIQVSSKSHLYLCGKQMVPTHNTETLLNIIGYYVDQDPSPILMILPTLEIGEAFSKDRLAPMIRDSPCLTEKVHEVKAKDTANTIKHKNFPGGHITIAGSNSAASLSSRPIRVVVMDEVDRFPVCAGTEGDPVSLAYKRTTTFWNRKLVLASTPTIKEHSRIETAFLESDQRKYFIPCQYCGVFQDLKWAQVEWPKDKPQKAVYVCESCKKPWSHADRIRSLSGGQWRAAQEFLGTRGFHLNELYSPWVDVKETVSNFLKAKHDPEQLKTWVNLSLGETFEIRDKPELDPHKFSARAEDYDAEVPTGVKVLTAYVDLQDDRLELEVKGWGKGKESWSICHHQLWGKPACLPHEGVWAKLTTLITKTYVNAKGEPLKISGTGIDTGGHYTDEAYAYVKQHEGHGVFATKGSSIPGSPLHARPGKRNKGNVWLFHIGTETAKDTVFANFKLENPGPGYMHFPKTYDLEYYRQLLSEKVEYRMSRGRRVKTYKQIRDRNEILDLAVGNLAILSIIGHDLDEIQNTPPPQPPRHSEGSPWLSRRKGWSRR